MQKYLRFILPPLTFSILSYSLPQARIRQKVATESIQAFEKGRIHSTRLEHRKAVRANVNLKAAARSCQSTGTSFSYHGGKLLEHPQIQVIFWGSQWSTQSREIITTKVTKMVYSPYLTKINPSVGCPVSLKFYWDSSTTPAPEASVDDEMLQLIQSGNVIAPDANPDNAYILIAPGVGYADGYYGYHTWMRLNTGAYVHYAIVDNYNLNQVTQTFSHELVETISDPRFGGFYGHDGGDCGEDPCENADACYCFIPVQGDVQVSFYYGANDAACVAPDGAGGCHN